VNRPVNPAFFRRACLAAIQRTSQQVIHLFSRLESLHQDQVVNLQVNRVRILLVSRLVNRLVSHLVSHQESLVGIHQDIHRGRHLGLLVRSRVSTHLAFRLYVRLESQPHFRAVIPPVNRPVNPAFFRRACLAAIQRTSQQVIHLFSRLESLHQDQVVDLQVNRVRILLVSRLVNRLVSHLVSHQESLVGIHQDIHRDNLLDSLLRFQH
jgi:hypothetical protein